MRIHWPSLGKFGDWDIRPVLKNQESLVLSWGLLSRSWILLDKHGLFGDFVGGERGWNGHFHCIDL
jgi:hypothetical protein